MTKLDRLSSIVLIAVVAAGAGWAASSFSNRQNSSVASSQPAVVASALPVNNLIAPEQAPAAPVQATSAMAPVAAAPRVAAVSKSLVNEAPAVVAAPVAESAPVARATRPRVVNPRYNENARAENRGAYRSAGYEPNGEPRRRGMSKTMKNAILIGGGAAMGATIGGIAKGGKGAAIGAAIGGGAGALYSWMKHKQNKPVF